MDFLDPYIDRSQEIIGIRFLRVLISLLSFLASLKEKRFLVVLKKISRRILELTHLESRFGV